MIRVAILGAGIGGQHLAAYRALPEFEVAAIVDLDRARAEALREDGDGFAVVTDIEAVLGDEDVDLIDICLPPHLHVAQTLAALEAGKAVICEKPLTTCLADAHQVLATSQRTGLPVFPVFQYRWGRSLAQLRYLMGQDLTGAPHIAALETHWSRGADYYEMPWRGTWRGEMGGAVLGHAIHNHDLLMSFLGPVAAVSAMVSTRVNPIETEDCASISFEMESGALATSSITLGAAFDETRLRFVFENLSATSGTTPYAPGGDPWSFVARDPGRQADIDQALRDCPAERLGFEGFLTEVGLAMSGQENRAVTLREGLRSIELVTAIYAAARSGQRVTLPIKENHPLYAGWLPD